MGWSRLLPLVVGLALLCADNRDARADGACVAIDTSRDNLTEQERTAVRVATATALEAEGIIVDHGGVRCTGMVTLYSVRLGRAITTTITTGPNEVHGQASSIDELDLLVRQLVRSLVTGRMFATGTGVQDRENVLRDQTAPLRVDPADRMWEPMVAIGGGMLQLPAIASRPRQRQFNIVSIDARYWGFITGSENGLEIRGRILLHDYDAISSANDAYEDSRDHDNHLDGDELGRGLAVGLSPLAVANWDVGIGLVRMLGNYPPHPYVRFGGELSILCRFSDPEHRFDVGPGAYAGLGFVFSPTVSLGIEANISRPLFASAYAYFMTTTAMLEIRSEPERGGPFQSNTPTIRRINE